ncbi:homocysteine S-methyltransferase [Leuconostoc citreum]|jgi:homocysteine S-methyltransferase|uniref:homocysteine S-methyltransferase n=1 Tax=Leuconostoc citreum TaxID=33964 RepID=UPI001C1F638A|nr:homocysteine S-methyltransferase [Leuconostoc citreum]MBU7450486.1 homocysteine S-methyltransferase [Leuconostoc citreum]
MTKFSELLLQGPVILDGGLGSEIDKQHIAVANNLWSASALIQAPNLVRDIHQSYFNAGAQIAIVDTYQAHPQTFVDSGLSENEAYELIDLAVALARDGLKKSEKSSGIIAGSVGPYGAYLANGAEYTGDYDLSIQAYQAFHRQRIKRLVHNNVDILALETMPNFKEAQAIALLLQNEFPEVEAYLSFATEAGDHLWDGTRLAHAVAYFNQFEQIKAIGINCTAPDNILPAITRIKPNTDKKVIVYPNAGEVYNPETKRWVTNNEPINWRRLVPLWQHAGADIIGGCCRTSPEDIREIHDILQKQ